MKEILLVTGNQNKLREWQALMPEDIILSSVDIDLPEIQSDDPEAIVIDKVKAAYAEVGKPVVVEDVSAALEQLNGLPGPFVKFFLKRLGSEALYILAGRQEAPATISCSVAYYDGSDLLTVRGDVEGTVVAPRGENNFGFDPTFVPNGGDKTFAEMTEDEKNSVSHRQKAIKLFVDAFEQQSL